jgi:Uma2 family endonuclease
MTMANSGRIVAALTSSQLQQRWQSTTEEEMLADYEGRAELDPDGEIVLTPPPSFVHQRIANELARQIENQLGGSAILECPVVVDGVLIADAAWFSGDRVNAITTPAAERPEIVLEVTSPRNTKRGLRSKAARFLAHGAQEVILVELDGTIHFISAAGENASSRFGLRLTLPPNTYPL